MLNDLRRRISYANVMSTIAVFGVLAGGGAYAASKIGPNEIKPNAVRSKHIKANAVRAKHVQPKSVKRKLGIGGTRLVSLPSTEPSISERVLARSGPIRLVGQCEGGAVPVARLLLRSNTAGGTFIGVRYTDGAFGSPLERVQGSLSSTGATLAATASELANSDAGASFTAWAGESTLSGQARTMADGCQFSFNGVAG